MECAIDFARAHDCKTLSLEVDIANHAALALYVKKGFFQCGLKPAYYKDGSDARAMLLML